MIRKFFTTFIWIIPLYVLVGLLILLVPIAFEFPDGYGEIPNWATVMGIAGFILFATGVIYNLLKPDV